MIIFLFEDSASVGYLHTAAGDKWRLRGQTQAEMHKAEKVTVIIEDQCCNALQGLSLVCFVEGLNNNNNAATSDVCGAFAEHFNNMVAVDNDSN